MARKSTSEIIESGTPKQRIKLFIDDQARKKFDKKRILNDEESLRLFDSFTTAKERDLLEKWRQLDKIVTASLKNLEGLKFNVLMNYSNLRGYILVWNTLEETEILINCWRE